LSRTGGERSQAAKRGKREGGDGSGDEKDGAHGGSADAAGEGKEDLIQGRRGVRGMDARGRC